MSSVAITTGPRPIITSKPRRRAGNEPWSGHSTPPQEPRQSLTERTTGTKMTWSEDETTPGELPVILKIREPVRRNGGESRDVRIHEHRRYRRIFEKAWRNSLRPLGRVTGIIEENFRWKKKTTGRCGRTRGIRFEWRECTRTVLVTAKPFNEWRCQDEEENEFFNCNPAIIYPKNFSKSDLFMRPASRNILINFWSPKHNPRYP